MLRREMFSSTKPRTVSIFFAGVIKVGAEISWRRDELSPFLSGCTLDSVSVSECPAKKCVPSFLTHCHLSSVSWFINITFVMKTDIQIIRCAFLSNSNVYINYKPHKPLYPSALDKIAHQKVASANGEERYHAHVSLLLYGYVQKKSS